jgi:hypothetical protein
MKTQRIPWVLGAALLASCYGYGAPDEVVFGEAVYTQEKPAYDFKPLSTYYLDPNIKIVEDNTSNEVAMPDTLKSTIDRNMQTVYGWASDQTIGVGGKPNANVRLKAFVLKGTGAVYYPGYWCDYWVYYGCYYDWYYAGSYKFGTILLDMGDLTQPPPTPGEPKPLDSLWVGVVYGVATSPTYDTQRILDGVNRAFSQSPYLDTH